MSKSEIIETLLEEDEEFKKLYFEHRELDEVIKSLEENESVTLDEVKRLKKIKLSLKDSMEFKIKEYKNK